MRRLGASGLASLRCVAGAFFFTIANAFAKEFFVCGGTQSTLMLARGTIAWTLNGLIATTQGAEFVPTMLFRTTHRVVLLASGTSNYVALGFLMIAIDKYILFGDAIGILIGVFSVSTMVLSRLLGKAEGVTLFEVAGGGVVIGGVICISQPSWLFPSAGGVGAMPPRPIGIVFCAVSGVCIAVYNLGCRHLGQKDVPAAIVNSGAMFVLGLYTPLVLAGCALVLGDVPRWAQLEVPGRACAWSYMLVYCGFITAAQLCFIKGLQSLRASTAAILGNTEILFAYLIGVFLLGQPTNWLAVLGNLVVFGGCALVALGAAREQSGQRQQQQQRSAAAVEALNERGLDAHEDEIEVEVEEFASPSQMAARATRTTGRGRWRSRRMRSSQRAAPMEVPVVVRRFSVQSGTENICLQWLNRRAPAGLGSMHGQGRGEDL